MSWLRSVFNSKNPPPGPNVSLAEKSVDEPEKAEESNESSSDGQESSGPGPSQPVGGILRRASEAGKKREEKEEECERERKKLEAQEEQDAAGAKEQRMTEFLGHTLAQAQTSSSFGNFGGVPDNGPYSDVALLDPDSTILALRSRAQYDANQRNRKQEEPPKAAEPPKQKSTVCSIQ